MRVVVVGAGGLGSYIGAVLEQAGHDVVLIARGAHRTAIDAAGLTVHTHRGSLVSRPGTAASALELDGADLTFLVTKTFSLDEVAPQLVHLARQGSDVVSLLNGVTARARLVAHGVPAEQATDGVAYMTAFRVAPGVVERKAEHHRIVVGDGRADGTVRRAFQETEVAVESAADIRVELWEKMAVVCSLAVLCAFAERRMGPLRGHPFGAELQRAAIAEVLAVGRAAGVPIGDDANARIDAALDRFPDDFYPSVIHDLKEGRRTEMDDLGGEIARLGRSLGVPTPLHDAGTLIVQLAEASPRS